MAKVNPRLEAARSAYREALEAARARPTPDTWTRLLAAGKALSSAQEPRSRSSRRSRRTATPTFEDLEGGPRDAPEPESHLE